MLVFRLKKILSTKIMPLCCNGNPADPLNSGQSSTSTSDLVEHLRRLSLLGQKPTTCYVYDSFMTKHAILKESSHPECPNRIRRIYSQLFKDGLLKSCQKLQSRFATLAELRLTHEKNYVDLMINVSTMNMKDMINIQKKFDSIYFCLDTYKCANLAVGSLLQVVQGVLLDKYANGFAIIRPPGHHAGHKKASGFCYFNNVALAAQFAVEKFGLKRILILDWDIHHGNGTQALFYDRPDILYISLHRYDCGAFYPADSTGGVDSVGTGLGLGFNVNIPWSGQKMGDNEYYMAFAEVIMPIAAKFDPQLVLVSAGFDAAIGDPLGGYRVSPECFAQITHWLTKLARGKVILALEGGYNLTSISLSMSACVEALLSTTDDDNSVIRTTTAAKFPACKAAVKTIENVKIFLKDYWPCLDVKTNATTNNSE